jgi:hypothetical protein
MLLPTRCWYILIYIYICIYIYIIFSNIFEKDICNDIGLWFDMSFLFLFWTKVLLQSISVLMNCELSYRIVVAVSSYMWFSLKLCTTTTCCVTSFQSMNHYSFLCDLLSTSEPLQHAVWPCFNIWTVTACCVTFFQPLNHYSMLCDLISAPEPLQPGVWPPFNPWNTIACCVTSYQPWTTVACCVTSFQPLNHYSLLCDLLSTSEPLQLAVWPPFNIWTTTAYCVNFQILNHYSLLCDLLLPLNNYSMLCDLISTSETQQHAVWPHFNPCPTVVC